MTDPNDDSRRGRAPTPPGNRPLLRGRHEADRRVRVAPKRSPWFRHSGPGTVTARRAAIEPSHPVGRLAARLQRLVFGRPLASEEEAGERLSKLKALAVFSSDNLSSVAYATEAILFTLLAAGTQAFGLTLPISILIVTVLGIIVISYRQTIGAYPGGGGSYIVAKENLGTMAGLIAAAALLTDYVLTVSVSVAAGVAAIASAFPGPLAEMRVPLSAAFIILVMVVNLRGIRESGSIFAIPTYFFILSIAVLIFLGIFRSITGGDVAINAPRESVQAVEGVSLFLILKAFTAGCTALTGVEAISDGVPAFKKPEADNAAKTLVWMCSILGAMFIGLSFLAHRYGIVPNAQETVISQIARTIVGHNFFYYFIQAMTALILVLAANTSFADFPRLSTWLAKDHYMPKQFLFRGDRLAFNTGITVLGVLATILLVIFGGETDRLLPLYAVGVFTAFTLSQGGMVLHWYKERGRGWTRRFALNLVGATATFFVLILVILTKFQGGAWIVLVLMPLLILLFRGINRHYVHAAAEQALDDDAQPAAYQQQEQVVIVPISDINKTTVNALNYARTLSPRIVGVHVTDDAEEAAHLQEKWEKWGEGVNLVILESPYRSLMGPLLSYIDMVQRKRPKAMITVLVPEYIPAHWWEQILHSQTALRLKASLLLRPNTVVTSVPYHGKN